MFIGHYKNVNKVDEFYSEKKDGLNFPTQVEYKGSRYLLINTYMANSKSQEDNIKKRAKKLLIILFLKIIKKNQNIKDIKNIKINFICFLNIRQKKNNLLKI